MNNNTFIHTEVETKQICTQRYDSPTTHIAKHIGNPVGLVQNLGSGVRDFFYEPLEGMSEGSLEAFLSGLGKGACPRRKQ